MKNKLGLYGLTFLLVLGLSVVALSWDDSGAWGEFALFLKKFSCNIIPRTDSTYDIGSSTYQVKTIYVDNISGLSTIVIPEKTPVNAVASEGLIAMSGVASADSTFAIDSFTFTWKSTRNVTSEVTIGDNADSAVTNIVTAVTADMSTVTAAYTSSSTATITAVTKGVSGNAIVFTEDSTNMAVDGAGTLGTTTAGVDGTIGLANETCADGTNLYHCITTNTIADNNWRLISLGSAY